MMSLGSSVRKSFHRTKHKHFKLIPKEAILASLSCQPRLPRAGKHLGSYTVTWIRELLMVNFNFRERLNEASLSLDSFPSFDALQTNTHFCTATREEAGRSGQGSERELTFTGQEVRALLNSVPISVTHICLILHYLFTIFASKSISLRTSKPCNTSEEGKIAISYPHTPKVSSLHAK